MINGSTGLTIPVEVLEFTRGSIYKVNQTGLE